MAKSLEHTIRSLHEAAAKPKQADPNNAATTAPPPPTAPAHNDNMLQQWLKSRGADTWLNGPAKRAAMKDWNNQGGRVAPPANGAAPAPAAQAVAAPTNPDDVNATSADTGVAAPAPDPRANLGQMGRVSPPSAPANPPKPDLIQSPQDAENIVNNPNNTVAQPTTAPSNATNAPTQDFQKNFVNTSVADQRANTILPGPQKQAATQKAQQDFDNMNQNMKGRGLPATAPTPQTANGAKSTPAAPQVASNVPTPPPRPSSFPQVPVPQPRPRMSPTTSHAAVVPTTTTTPAPKPNPSAYTAQVGTSAKSTNDIPMQKMGYRSGRAGTWVNSESYSENPLIAAFQRMQSMNFDNPFEAAKILDETLGRDRQKAFADSSNKMKANSAAIDSKNDKDTKVRNFINDFRKKSVTKEDVEQIDEKKKNNEPKKFNPIAKDLRTPKYAPRTVAPKKGKGSYDRKDKNMNNEEVENIDEVSKGKLQNYIKDAESAKKSFHNYTPSKLKNKTQDGIDLAKQKIDKVAKVDASEEFVAEKVATKQQRYAEFISKERAKQGLKNVLAGKPVSDKKPTVAKEEVEQIDELSKKTLVSYANKAQRKADSHENKGRSAEEKAMETDGMKHPDKQRKHLDTANKEFGAANKRQAGVNMATAKVGEKAAKKIRPSDHWGKDRLPKVKVMAKEDVEVSFSDEELAHFASIMGNEE